MRASFTKIVSLLLSVLVLFSTMSFTINKHYCGKMLVDVAINKKAKTCGMEMMAASTECSISKKSCCQDEHIVILGQDKLKKNLDTSIEFLQVAFAVEKNLFICCAFQETTLFIPANKKDPPERQFDFQLRYQTFLI